MKGQAPWSRSAFRTGNWTPVMGVQNLPPDIRIAMDQTANPGGRVRAVDGAGRVADIL